MAHAATVREQRALAGDRSQVTRTTLGRERATHVWNTKVIDQNMRVRKGDGSKHLRTTQRREQYMSGIKKLERRNGGFESTVLEHVSARCWREGKEKSDERARGQKRRQGTACYTQMRLVQGVQPASGPRVRGNLQKAGGQTRRQYRRQCAGSPWRTVAGVKGKWIRYM
jgi:hypothetical protein